MGCFNKTGFFSHLPIQYGDEIVLFVFADQSKAYKRSSCPIDPTGGGLTPICPPFFGKYNDYGGIENVVDDPNHKYFTKVVGMTVDKFCDIIHDLSGVTIKDLRDGIKKYTEKPESENHYHYETKDDFEKMLALYTKLFKVKEFNIPMPKKDAGLDEETVRKIKETIEGLQKWENERIENSAITVGMEHKSVYDSLVAAGKANYGKGWFKTPVSPEDAFDNSLKLYRMIKEEEGDEMESFNPLTAGVESQFRTDDAYDHFFGIKTLLHDTVHIDGCDFALYKDMKEDFEEYKDVFVEFAYFISTFKRMCCMFDVSPYHNQEVSYEYLIPVFESILDTLKESAKKRDYEENEE